MKSDDKQGIKNNWERVVNLSKSFLWSSFLIKKKMDKSGVEVKTIKLIILGTKDIQLNIIGAE